ncbi:MAG: KEOPS complex kinase/ATPase Bud32 [archaeon]
MESKLIAQGAEAKIVLSNNFIIKDRVKKSYRIPELDEKIRKQRTKSEIKLLEKASKIINIPKLICKDSHNLFRITMQFLDGKRLSDSLDNFPLSKQKQILKQIGKDIAKLHDKAIIHGDLTTSNMILKNEKIYLIDFGLGYFNGKYEDKAVDIHLLKQALEAKHFKHWEALFNEFLKGYTSTNKVESKKVLERLRAVEKRGRYKH